MDRAILEEHQVRELISENRYKVDPKTRFISRCIDGRYENQKDLPALAIAGADAGQLGIIFAASKIYGLELDREKAFKSLIETVQGEKNLRVHTGCGHMKQQETAYGDYNLDKKDIEFIKEKAKKMEEIKVEGEHVEGAVLQIRGEWGVFPRYIFKTTKGDVLTEVFISHQTLSNERHKILAEKLLKNKAFPLLKEDHNEYLYMVLTETLDFHLFETAKRLASGLPLYDVKFEENGDFDLTKLDNI